MEIEIGLDFMAAEQEVTESRKPAEIGDYTLQVIEIRASASGPTSKVPGRPMLGWELAIIGHPTYNGKRVFYNTMLPYADPNNGNKLNTSGISFLVDITKALGQPWQGGKLRTEEYIGKTCRATIGIEVNPKTGEQRNSIGKVFA